MPDKEVVVRHPFHPAFVHFPVACWVLSHPADLLVLSNADITVFGLDWWALSVFLIWAGVISALPAMAVGIYDFMQLPDEDRLMQAFYKHVSFVGTAWIVYLISAYTRLGDNLTLAQPELSPVIISGCGLVCLAIGGWYGGQMVYKYHLGMTAGD